MRIWDAGRPALFPNTTWWASQFCLYLGCSWLLLVEDCGHQRDAFAYNNVYDTFLSCASIHLCANSCQISHRDIQSSQSRQPAYLCCVNHRSFTHFCWSVLFLQHLNLNFDISLSKSLGYDPPCGETHLHILTLYRFSTIRTRTPLFYFCKIGFNLCHR